MPLPLSKLPPLAPKIQVIKTLVGDTNFIAYCDRNLPGRDLAEPHARIREQKRKEVDAVVQELRGLLNDDANPKYGNQAAD